MTNAGEKARANTRTQTLKFAMKRASQLGEKLLEPQLKITEKLATIELETAEMMKLEAALRAQTAKESREASARCNEKLERQAASVIRPTTVLRPEVKDQDGSWSASYGDVHGVGPTPELACQDFDRKWLGKDEL